MDEKLLKGHNILLLAQSDGCSVLQFRNKTGEGTMTCYDIFPGAMLSFNDFHMAYFDSEYSPSKEILAIDHCREGRMEYIASENAYAYMESGDMKIDHRRSHIGRFVFPANHFHGLTIVFDMKTACESLKSEIKDFPVDLRILQEKYCGGTYPKLIPGIDITENIFKEFYQVPKKIRIPYFKVKIMELLLCLDAIELPAGREEQPYYYKTQIEKVKAIQAFILEHFAENFTQRELSCMFDIPFSGMKNCFKSIYGDSIGVWLSKYRMNQAAELLLKNRDMNVSEVAGSVGYDSPGKFAITFRKIMGMSPREYRNAIRRGGSA